MPDTNTNTAAGTLKNYVERIERLEDEKKNVMDDIKDVYGEAANDGYDKKALKLVIKNRKADKAARESLEAIVETYEAALTGV